MVLEVVRECGSRVRKLPLLSLACAVSALFIAVYIELFHEACVVSRGAASYGLLAGEVTLSAVLHVLALALIAFVLFEIISQQRRLLAWLFRHRVALCIGIVALCTLVGLSGSSLAQWDVLTGTSPRGTLLGMSRALRSDEWAVNTVFAAAQQGTGFQAWSTAIADGSDVTMVYAQPCWALATLFRPFLWGYLFFGFSHGLAFFWSARTAALFLVSLQMGLLITRDRRDLSFAFALLVTFSQSVQWWYAVNGTAELLIFGQGLVLVLHHFLESERLSRRWMWAALLAWLICCFALILYPAWQVPVAYACGAMGVWLIVRHVRSNRARPSFFRFYLLPLLCSMLVFAGLVGIVLFQAQDVISAVRSSLYPGSRFETGGGVLRYLFGWGYGLFTPIAEADFMPADGSMNACEYVSMFGLFPLGIIVAIVQLVRKRDGLLIAVLAVYAFLAAYGIIGFPGWLARISLLSNVTFTRLLLVLSFLDIVLLMRSLALAAQGEAPAQPRPFAWAVVLGASALFTVAIAFCTLQTITANKRMLFMGLMALLVFVWAVVVLAAMFARGRKGLREGACVAVLACAIALPGLCVNPLQLGADSLTDSAIGNVASQIQEQEAGTWIADAPWQSQLVIAQGIPCPTGVSTYPHISYWSTIDPDGSFVDAYNRYAWIAIEATDGACEFETTRADCFTARLALADARALGVSYWLTSSDLVALAGSSDAPQLVGSVEGTDLKVYKL